MLLGSNTQTQQNKKTEKSEISSYGIMKMQDILKIALELSYIVIKL